MRPNRKRQEKSNGEDRISTLADDVLAHILSFLPTKHAVETSVLSKRWKYVWTSVPILDINDWLVLHKKVINSDHDADICVTHFMNKILNLHTLSCVRKIRLHFDREYNEDIVEAWISTLTRPNIEELDLFIGSVDLEFCLPQTVYYTCQNLVHLKLAGFYIDVNVSLVCLPRLKTLCLVGVPFVRDDSMKKLLSGCPVLTELYVESWLWENAMTSNACPASLERLTIHDDDILFSYSHPETSTETSIDNLPVFHSLTHLSLIFLMVEVYPILLHLLERSPVLKSLKLAKGYDGDGWPTPDRVYECILNHLQTIEIEFFCGLKNEMEMIGYFLKNSMVLKKMIIHPCSSLKSLELTKILKKLLMFPRGSSSCQIEILN